MKPVEKFEHWKLLPATTFPCMYSDVGEIKFDDQEWRIGRSEQDLSLYVFTTLPHPDNPNVTAIYKLSCGDLIPPLCDHIINEGKSNDTPTH